MGKTDTYAGTSLLHCEARAAHRNRNKISAAQRSSSIVQRGSPRKTSLPIRHLTPKGLFHHQATGQAVAQPWGGEFRQKRLIEWINRDHSISFFSHDSLLLNRDWFDILMNHPAKCLEISPRHRR